MNEIEIHRLDTLIEEHAETKLIAMIDGKFVGTMGVEFDGLTVASFRQLFVEVEERRRGIATALIEEACAIATDAGCVAINASLSDENHVLYADFYRPLGFVLAFKRPGCAATIARPLNP